MPTTAPSRRTVFTNVNDAHQALFADDIESPVIEFIPMVVDATKDVLSTEIRMLLGVDGEYHVLRGRGTATRAQGDVYDARVASRIALARSLDAISAKLKRQANGYMDENEWIANDQARRKEINAQKSALGRLEADERQRRLDAEAVAGDLTECGFELVDKVDKVYEIDIPDASVDAVIDSLTSDDGTRRALEGLFGRRA